MFECATNNPIRYIVHKETVILFDNATELFAHITGLHVESC
jgi:hypothetical protein